MGLIFPQRYGIQHTAGLSSLYLFQQNGLVTIYISENDLVSVFV